MSILGAPDCIARSNSAMSSSERGMLEKKLMTTLLDFKNIYDSHSNCKNPTKKHVPCVNLAMKIEHVINQIINF